MQLYYIPLVIYMKSFTLLAIKCICPLFLLSQSSVFVQCLFKFEYGHSVVISLCVHIGLSNIFSLSAVCQIIMIFAFLFWTKDSDFMDYGCGEKANASM